MPEWIQNIDDQVLAWFQDHRTAWLNYNLQQVTALGSTTVVVLLSIFAVGLLILEKQFLKAALVLVLPIGAYFASDAIKDAVARHRPLVGQPPKALSKSHSFPSGHACLSMTGFLVVALGLKPFWRRAYPYVLLWAVGMSVLVGATRLYFGNHFLSDVVAGWLLGIGFAVVFLGVSRLAGGREKAVESSV